jgi:hypothetical protein
MAVRKLTFVAVSTMALGLSACAGSGFMPGRLGGQAPAPPADPVPGPVVEGTLNDPLTANPGQNVAGVDNDPASQPAPSAPGSTVAFGRTDLLGGWRVAAGSDNCELFMSLTGWAGGYRATTKGCASAVLTNVQAWNVENREVILISGNGETVARLYATASERFNGQTEDGIGITVFR